MTSTERRAVVERTNGLNPIQKRNAANKVWEDIAGIHSKLAPNILSHVGIATSSVQKENAQAKPQDSKEGKDDARPIQPKQLPGTAEGGNSDAATPGNGNRKPMDAGVAQEGSGADRGGRVPGRAESPGGSRTRGVQQSGEPASSTARDSGSVRADQRAADAVADPATSETSPKPELDQPEDFRIDSADIGKGGLTKKYRDNIAAIRILKAMAAEGRKATPEERRKIARYVGWGALKGVFDKENKQWAAEYAELRELLTDAEYKAARASTLNAHYTSPVIVTGIYQALARLGFAHGRVLEPSVGTGNFFGLMPAAMRKSSQLHGVELDPLTSQIAAALYPSAKIAQATGFQDFKVPAEYFDVAIGNPPFGSEPIVDPERAPYSGASIHNYFFAKSIDKLRPGGILAMVVSHNFLDAKSDTTRRWIADRANLIGAVRLPRTAFKENAGTDVVTDILVFQKKTKSEQANGLGDSSWVKTGTQALANPKSGEETNHTVSQYFLSNSANVLGTPTAAGSMYRAGEYTVEPSGDLATQVAEWASKLPEGIYRAVERTHEDEAANVEIPDGVKVGSFYLDKDGEVKLRGPDSMGNKTAIGWQPPNGKAIERMRGMIGLRDALRNQMRMERTPDVSNEEIEAGRAELNRLYDEFKKSSGFLNDPTNRRIFLDDTESALLLALEFDYDKGVSKAVAEREGIEPRPPHAVKADIFSRRVMFPPQENIKVSSAKDALLASLNYKGRLDAEYMASLYDKSASDIVSELGDLVFTDPVHGLVMADEYLSGDVKTKLAEAEAYALENPDFKRNVEALKKVIPADKRPSEIHAALGASFVPADLFEAFAKEITGADSVKASYIKSTGQWVVLFGDQVNQSLNSGKWGITKMPATTIFMRTMAGQGVVVVQVIRNNDGSTSTIVLEKETEAAREKQAAMKAEWQRWLWSDPARADRVATIYNDKMNRIVPRKYDGSHMTFPGMSPAMELLPHQKNAVWRALQSRQILLDHVVGAGKTFEVVAAIMEMRRLGIARKPIVAVPNHLTLQWRSEFSRLYPTANVLAATPEDFAKGSREKFFSKIVTGDWDAVIVGHSSLKKISLPEETEKAVLEEQISELSDAIEDMKRARGDRHIIRDMEGILARLAGKMQTKMQALGERDKVVTFDELGIDAFAVDELHAFKNLFYNSTMERVPGMGNPAGSDKAFDLFVKLQYLFNTFGDKAPIIGATGTPVSNSLVEMFNMQRFLQYPLMKAEGLHVFDAWAKQFGSVESVYEVSPSGTGYRQSSRFSKFKNLPALMAHYQTFADTVTLDDLKAQEEARGKAFPVPKVAGGRPSNVVAKRSEQVSKFMGVPELDMADGAPLFGFNPARGDTFSIEKTKEGDAWRVEYTSPVGENSITGILGVAKTEEDARLIVVEAALSPRIKVDPESILGKFQNLRYLTKSTKGKVNALSLTGDANKAGLDYRLIDPSAKDFPGSKINLAVDRVVQVYEKWSSDKGTQLVFCDLSVPLSARSGFGSKDRRLYVKEDGKLAHKRGTMHTVAGHEDLPFFVVKDSKGFTIYDAATGIKIHAGLPSKAIALDWASTSMKNEAMLQRWIDGRDQAGDIQQDQIEEYNNENEIDTESGESITLADISGISGNAKFSVYDDIRAKLVARGIPEREIAFIHDYNTPTAKEKLFRAVNAGSVRVLLGSTEKMGAGTNVQKLLVALHHIDAPWKPSDLEQREGRIIRRGNLLYERDPSGFSVEIYRYATEQTYDTRRWQILEHKARGIEQLRNYDGTLNEIDDIEGEAANSADMKAAASGDPLILEETKLRNDVRRLEALQASHADEKQIMLRRAKDNEFFATKTGPQALEAFRELKSVSDKIPVEKDQFVGLEVGKKRFADREEAVKAIKAAMDRIFINGGTEVMRYRGIEFTLEGTPGYAELNSPTGGMDRFDVVRDPVPSAAGFLARFSNYISRFPAQIAYLESEIGKATELAKQQREESAKPFQQAADLESAREAHKKVQRQLISKGPEIPAKQKPILEAAMIQQKEELKKLGLEKAMSEFLGNSGNASFGAVRGSGSSSTDQAIFDLLEQARGASEVLDFIRSKSNNTFNRQLARILSALGLKTQVKQGASKGLVFMAGPRADYSAAYDPKRDEATLFHPNDAERHVLHELVHAATVTAISKPGLAATRMKNLYRHVQKQGGVKGLYGLTSVEEFVAEAFTNPEFQQYLKSISAPIGSPVRNAWNAMVRIVKSILGIKNESNDNALSAALDLGVAVMRENMATQAKSSPSSSVLGSVGFKEASSKAVSYFNDKFNAPGTVSVWHKTVGTMYNLAERSPAFKAVFDTAQGFLDDVSHYATDAADQAPSLLPKLEHWRDIAKAPISAKDNAAISRPIFEGTLNWSRDIHGRPVLVRDLEKQAQSMSVREKADRLLGMDKLTPNVHKMWLGLPADQYAANIESRYASAFLQPGIVWTPGELKSMFGLSGEQLETGAWAGQIGLYHEFRDSVDRSLDSMARADMLRYGGKDAKPLRDAVMAAPDFQAAAVLLRDHMASLAEADPERADMLLAMANTMMDKADKVATLQAQGYAPLSRFGRYSVDVVTNGERQYFGLFETRKEANAMAQRMGKEFGPDSVTQGTMSQEAFKLFAGVTPETLELFGNALGLDSTGDAERDKLFQEYLKKAKNNRSAMKRLIHRQGIEGFSRDVSRVLASFIYSNARQTAAGLNIGDLGEAVDAIPKEQGELKDIAVGLADYVKNPQEEAQAIRGLLFAQYLGGSVASAFVNMTQPIAVTFPWLSQFGGARQAASQLSRAAKDIARGSELENGLREALHIAEEEGTVSPQEIHHLMAQARGQGVLQSGDGTRQGEAVAKARNALSRLSFAWGKVFGMAEQVNRRITFVAAYRVAQSRGIEDPASFAKLAVIETQFQYSKANKMKWGRGAIGGTLMTFKTYSIAYLELLHRMYTHGGPEGKKAALLALAMLMVMGGAGGLPFAEDATDAAEALAEMLGYNLSVKKAREQFFTDLFGDAMAQFIENGITGLPGSPIDISGRMGMGNLIPGTGLLLPKSSHTSDMLEIVGPAGDMAKRMFEGAGALVKGDVGGAAMAVAPQAVRNMVKGADMAATGMYRDQKGYKVLDTDLLEAAMKSVGFQPHSVARVQEANAAAQQLKNFYNLRAQEIRAKWAQGIFEHDQEKVAEARAEVADWNEKNPGQRMVISIPSVLRKAREMGKPKDERIAETAPRAMRDSLKRELANSRE